MDDQNKSVNDRWAPPTNRGERGYAADPDFSSRADAGADFGTSSREAGDEAFNPRTTELRHEIDDTRANMGETIDAIQERLRPGNVAARAAENVRDATVGRVKEFAGSITGRRDWQGDRDDDWRYRSSGWDGTSNGVLDRIRENPFAAAMAAGSIAWLLFGSRRSRGYQYSSADRERAMYGSTRGGQAFVREARFDFDESPSRYGAERRDWGPTASEDRDWGEATGRMTDRAREVAADTGQRMRHAASDVRRRTRSVTSESPLATGAIATNCGPAPSCSRVVAPCRPRTGIPNRP